MPKFSKILIANRGEIACRIARTARAMGYTTVAVYSAADANAKHLSDCDEAVLIGPASVAESYLSSDRIIDAAKRTGADAVHPGYGFLSENAAFAAACVTAGLVFIGPPASAIAAMGNKAAAKRRMIDAGVPCVPGYQGADQSDTTLIHEAAQIGYPVMVKAAAGGGGRGMRLVTHPADIAAALGSARSEAEHAFGSGELILEKAVVDARHVEIQVFGDTLGNVVHLGERDCSVQRRHQKVIEEAPSPAVDADLRARMGAVAVKAAVSINYVGAGTVEFLLGADKQFYFLEMNTRLQVEHPVTELITGLDLVDWQIRIARGEALPLAQAEVNLTGHAMEVRLYAEDPAQSFLPQSGTVHAWHKPEGLGIRVDDGLNPSDTVSPDYDPMIAKIVAFGATREAARTRLIRAVRDAQVIGIMTNKAFLIDLLGHPEFAAGQATTAFIGKHFSNLSRPTADTQTRAAAALLLLEACNEMPTSQLAGWSSTGSAAYPVLLDDGCAPPCRVVLFPVAANAFEVQDGDRKTHVSLAQPTHGLKRHISIDGHQYAPQSLFAGGTLYLTRDEHTFEFRDRLREPRQLIDNASGLQLLAPMNGRVVRVLARAGDTVAKGQCIIVLEAMKMQHEITANRAGTLAHVPVQEGQQVATRALLAELTVADA